MKSVKIVKGERANRFAAVEYVSGEVRYVDVTDLSIEGAAEKIREDRARRDARESRVRAMQAGVHGKKIGQWTVAGVTVFERGTDVELFVSCEKGGERVYVRRFYPSPAAVPADADILKIIETELGVTAGGAATIDYEAELKAELGLQ